MKRVLGYVLLGAIAYAGFLLALTPAAWPLGLLAARLPDLTVEQAHGSVLYGRAREIGLRGVEIASLAWSWRPLALFSGRVEYSFTLTKEPGLYLKGRAAMGLDRRLDVERLHGYLPVAEAIALAGHTPPSLLGEVRLELAELRLDAAGRPQAAQGEVHLIDARSTFPRLKLGSFDLDLATGEEGIVGSVRDAGGPLELTGTLTLTPDGRYRFSGQAGARDPANRELQGILHLLGRPGRDGKSRIDISGALNL